MTDLLSAMKQRQESHTAKRSATVSRPSVDMTEWVETTTVRPRERPKPGKPLQPPTIITPAPEPTSTHSLAQRPHHIESLQTVPTADLLGVASQPNSMHRSLDSSLGTFTCHSSTSPFGDDFSQYVPQAKALPATNIASVDSHTGHQLGFEDSFSDLLIQSTASSQSQVRRTAATTSYLLLIYSDIINI